MLYVLDTDTMSLIQAGNPKSRERKNLFDAEAVVITIVTRIEVLQGRFDYLLKAADGSHLRRAFEWLLRSESLLEDCTALPIDAAAAAEFDRLRDNKKLKKVGRADLLIAAIALARRATVVTRNTRHFRDVPGLRVENWAD